MERLGALLPKHIRLNYASSHVNKVARLMDTACQTIFRRYDVVHCDVFSGQSFWVAELVRRIAEQRQKAVIMNIQGGRFVEFLGESDRRARVFQTWAHSGISLISPSRFLASEIEGRWDILIRVIPNFINQCKFPFNSSVRTGYRLLWVRGFNDIYQPEIAVEALALLRSKYRDITLTMIGPDKGKLAEIQGLIDRLGISERIEIIGPVQNEELYRYFHSHDVYLNTTAYESFGLAILEAASCGIPIISTEVGELPHMWQDKRSIIFVQEQSGKIFAEAIGDLFEDREFMNSMQYEAKRIADQYTWELVQPSWFELLAGNQT